MLRTKDFRLGQIHGKLQAEDGSSEAHIQRTVFLSQKLRICRTRIKSDVVRIFGYEVPLETGHTRGECVDLMGYDRARNLYVIELKKKNSSERMPAVIRQVNDYVAAVKKILPHIEREFEQAYFLPISFAGIRKVILAPREFYDEGRKKEAEDHSIEYAYFRDKDITKRKPGEPVNIHLVKK